MESSHTVHFSDDISMVIQIRWEIRNRFKSILPCTYHDDTVIASFEEYVALILS